MSILIILHCGINIETVYINENKTKQKCKFIKNIAEMREFQ